MTLGRRPSRPQSDEKMQPSGGKNQRAQDDMKANGREREIAPRKHATTKREQHAHGDNDAGGKDMKGEGREART